MEIKIVRGAVVIVTPEPAKVPYKLGPAFNAAHTTLVSNIVSTPRIARPLLGPAFLQK